MYRIGEQMVHVWKVSVNAAMRPGRAMNRPLKSLFDSVSPRYDRLNRLLTWGLDERWRARAARCCLADRPGRVLDLCCGTGDLALHLAAVAEEAVDITGLDYSAPMLTVARQKAARHALQASPASKRRVRFIEGDAASMGFHDETFDAVGIAFAFRNLTWRNPVRDAALAEVRRVLRPNGRFVILETSQPDNLVLRGVFHLYMRLAVAAVGGWVSGQRTAYGYLATSARKFHRAEQVSHMLAAVGFANVRVRPLIGGVAAIHVAR